MRLHLPASRISSWKIAAGRLPDNPVHQKISLRGVGLQLPSAGANSPSIMVDLFQKKMNVYSLT